MLNSVISKMAFRSIKAQKLIFRPFIFSSTLLLALHFIILSLMNNSYIHERHSSLPQIFGMGVFFITLLNMIIIIYVSNFVQNRLTHEYGLYSVLGLEKKHLRRMAGLQYGFCYLVSTVPALFLGYLLGNFVFVAITRLSMDYDASFRHFPFDGRAAVLLLVISLIVYVLIYIKAVWGIQRFKPLELMKQSSRAEGEPKSRWLLLVFCLTTLGAGYYIALTTESVMNALVMIFVAIFLVILGTYALFSAVSIVVLKALKSKKNFYYQDRNFLSISGLIHRMQSNAVSLASIAILASGVILVMGLTVTTMRSMENFDFLPAQFEVGLPKKIYFEEGKVEAISDRMLGVRDDLEKNYPLGRTFLERQVALSALWNGSSLEVLQGPQAGALPKGSQPTYVLLRIKEDYYDRVDQVDEGNRQWLITSNMWDLGALKSVKVNGQDHEVKVVDKKLIPDNLAIEAISLWVNDQAEFDEVKAYLEAGNGANPTYTSLYFDLDEKAEVEENELVAMLEAKGFEVQTFENIKKEVYGINGGLIVIGLLVSLILLIGMMLVLYFKQVFEGYQDRKNYQIMKQVGLPRELIKSTINQQVLWVFFLPLVIACIHNLFASKILYRLISMLGYRDLTIYITSFLMVVVVFGLFYWIFYKISSRTYYLLVNEKAED